MPEALTLKCLRRRHKKLRTIRPRSRLLREKSHVTSAHTISWHAYHGARPNLSAAILCRYSRCSSAELLLAVREIAALLVIALPLTHKPLAEPSLELPPREQVSLPVSEGAQGSAAALALLPEEADAMIGVSCRRGWWSSSLKGRWGRDIPGGMQRLHLGAPIGAVPRACRQRVREAPRSARTPCAVLAMQRRRRARGQLGRARPHDAPCPR